MQEKNQTVVIEKDEYFDRIIQDIKARPGMFLGSCSITRLRSFLDGYQSARADLGIPRTHEERAFDGFQSWVQARFQVTSAQGWDSIILLHSSNEQEALQLFFDLLEQFRQEQTSSSDRLVS
jgi:hypothetical protein